MKNNKSIYKYIFYVVLFLSSSTTIWANGNKLANTKDYHIRKGFTVWSNNQVREYKFNNVAENVGYLTMYPKVEVKQKIPDEILESWEIEYRIFTSINDAELSMVERLDMSNLFVYNIIDFPLPKGEIGDNCWYQLSVGAIQFLRNNVYVSITPKTYDSTVDTTIAEWLARQVDTLLLGSDKVDNVNLIPAPQIQSVDILSELPSNWESTVSIKVNATTEKSQKLFYRKYADGFAIVSENGNLSISLNKNTDSTEDTSKAKIKIWIWNEDYITSSVEKELPF